MFSYANYIQRILVKDLLFNMCNYSDFFASINKEAGQVSSPSERNKSISLGGKTQHCRWSLLPESQSYKVVTWPFAAFLHGL